MQTVKLRLVVILCLSLSGCMTVEHLNEDYNGLGMNSITTQRGSFNVVDNTKTGKLFVEPGFGFALTKGTPPLPWAKEAAMAWLEKSGRNCTIKDGYLFQAPHYEFLYSCSK